MEFGTAALLGVNPFVQSANNPSPIVAFNSDAELLDRCRQGEREAFDTLISRHKRAIFNLAYRLTGAYDDANDLASEVYLRVYRSIGSLHQDGSFKVWINRIVINAYYDKMREAQRRPAVSLDALMDTGMEPTNDNSGVRKQHPLEIALTSDLNQALNASILSLPSAQRVAILLFHMEGRSYEEIAAIQRIPIGTVKSRLNRARLSLQNSLTPYFQST